MTWSAELLVIAAAVLQLLEPKAVEQLRRNISELWAMPMAEVRIEADSTALAALASAGDLCVTGVLADGRVRFADGALQRVRVRAGIAGTLPVAAHDIARGSTLEPDDIRLLPAVAWGGRVPKHSTPLGFTAARTLRAGDRLIAPAVTAPVAVRAGEDVRALWLRGAVQLEVTARAAGNGAIGDTIAVRTPAGRRVQGVIRAPREVVLLGSEGGR